MIPETTKTYDFYCTLCHFPVARSEPTMDSGTGADADCLVEKHTWGCLNWECRHHDRHENKVATLTPPKWVGHGEAPFAPTIGLLMARLRCDEVLIQHDQPIARATHTHTFGSLYGLTVSPYRVQWYRRDIEKKGFVLAKVTRVKPNGLEVYSTIRDSIWVTKAGEWWPVRQMLTRHLLNTLALVKKAAIVKAATINAQNVYLSVMFDREDVGDMMDMVPSDDPEDLPKNGWMLVVPPIFDALRAEAARRTAEKTAFEPITVDQLGEYYVVSDADNKMLMGYEVTLTHAMLKNKKPKRKPY